MNAHSRFPSVQKTGGRLRPGSHIERALVGHYLNAHNLGGVEATLQRHYPDDTLTQALVTRAAVTPTSTSNATAVLQEAVADYMVALAPLSAGAKLMQSAVRVDLQRNVEVSIPGRVVTAADGGSFVIEGEPIKVIQPALTSASLVPRKLAALGVFSNELSKRSLPSIESVIANVMREGTALSFDAALFSDDAGDTSKPAGLLNGIVATTASVSAGPFTAVLEDVRALVGAVADAGGGASLGFVCSARQGVFLNVLAGERLGMLSGVPPVLISNAVPAGTVICLDVGMLAFGFGLEPRIEARKDATIVMRDDPTAIGTAGTPAVVGAPTRDLFSTDTTALKLVLDVAWTRRANQISYVENVGW